MYAIVIHANVKTSTSAMVTAMVSVIAIPSIEAGVVSTRILELVKGASSCVAANNRAATIPRIKPIKAPMTINNAVFLFEFIFPFFPFFFSFFFLLLINEFIINFII